MQSESLCSSCALRWIYFLIVVIFWKIDRLSPCGSGVIDTVEEAGDERRQAMKRKERERE